MKRISVQESSKNQKRKLYWLGQSVAEQYDVPIYYLAVNKYKKKFRRIFAILLFTSIICINRSHLYPAEYSKILLQYSIIISCLKYKLKTILYFDYY